MSTSDIGFNQTFNMATIKQVINEAVERVRMPTPMRLRDLIRQIRSARTAAEERAVINKECAYIRSTFREEDSVWRCRNIAKLLYIHMLGYPAHFGQLECLKLIASSRFTDKRIGYLGAMLLLDERQDVHLLITNCLKNDLNSSTQFTVGLALCTLGAIASPEMSRDLATEVERLMKSPNVYIRKKATLCAYRIILKVPELIEIFLPATRSLLSEKNHGILITSITLITRMCEGSIDMLQHFKKIVPNLVRILKNLILAGYSPEHDVSGVSDPFLQVKILRLLRILGKNDTDASEAMNDILAQVATNTETSKNVGSTILYETVLSIMDIKSESGLRVLAVNILGRFLLNNDKNIRYVALNTLLKTVHVDNNAVQRHRTTILECLKDMDVSIRRRALELSFALINTHNIRSMMKELLNFLEKADPEFKTHCSSSIMLAAEKYAPNIHWHLDTLLKILIAAGNYVRDDVISSVIQLIMENPSQQSYGLTKLWEALEKDVYDKQPLTQVATWVIGEYGELLITPAAESIQVTEEQILEVYQRLLYSQQCTVITKQYVINSLMKLSSHFCQNINVIKDTMHQLASHLHMELQQRGMEYYQLCDKYNHLRPAVFERMPPLELYRATDESTLAEDAEQPPITAVCGDTPSTENEAHYDSNAILVLLGGSSYEGENVVVTAAASSLPSESQPPMTKTDHILDLLADIGDNSLGNSFGISTNGPSLTGQKMTDIFENDYNHMNTIPPVANTISGGGSSTNTTTEEFFNSIFDSGHQEIIENSKQRKSNSDSRNCITVYDKNGLIITFSVQLMSEAPGVVVVNMVAYNNGPFAITDFLFQAAVPKALQLTMLPPSSTVIPPDAKISQVLRVGNATKSNLKMKIRINFRRENEMIQEQLDVTSFPLD